MDKYDTILGFSPKNFPKAYKLYVYYNEREPKDIFDIVTFYDKTFPYHKDAESVIGFASKLIAADDKIKNIDNFYRILKVFVDGLKK